MPDTPEHFLAEWHPMVADRDLDALHDLLAADVSLGVPPYWAKLSGREISHHLLGLIVHTIDDFTYHREWQTGNQIALEFKGSVDGLALQGIDLITLNEGCVVQDLEVLMRPLNAIEKLRDVITPQMTAFLAERAKA